MQAIGFIDQPPLWPGANTMGVYTDRTTDFRPGNAVAQPLIFRVSPGYFQAAGTTLPSGRSIGWHDDKNAPRVAVINQEFARTVFGSAPDVNGRRFKLRDGSSIEVVGIAEDGKYGSITEDAEPAMFLPLQSPTTTTWFVVRSARNPVELAAAVRTTVRSIDAALPISTETWENELNAGTVQFGPRMASAALGVLGGMAAILSVTGIFGLAAYSLSRRRREIGIRMALGAHNREVLRAVLGRTLGLVAAGSAAGLVLGLLASRLLGVLVSQATARDPLVLAGVVGAMALLGLLGTWIPAQRALAVSPLILLHEE